MKGKKTYAWIGLVALVLSIIALALSLQSSVSKSNEQWVCSQVVCDKLMSQQEWVSQNCRLNASNEMNCLVNIYGRPAWVPLKALNLSNIRACAEYRCVQEMLVRPANYTIKPRQ